MERNTRRLTALKVERLKDKPGMHADGGGLYLQVKNGGASWVWRFALDGRSRYLGLGPLALFGLADARAKALDAGRLRHGGTDPIAAKRAERARRRLEAAKAITFKECREKYVAAHKAGWRNEKHGEQWANTLSTYAEPLLNGVPVSAIDTSVVMRVFERDVDGLPFWQARPETASRVRQRIEAVLDWARVRGYRDGENPARWKGHLDHLLPAREKVRRVAHHAALPYADIGDFTAALKAQDGVAARALEFVILTAARTAEVVGATWGEIDLTAKVWTVPPERMKAGKEHRVPLSPRAIEIIKAMLPEKGETAPTAYVFSGAKPGKPLSNMAMEMTLRRMKRDDITVHGFRSTFRDWAAERTGFPREVAEMALAHAVGDKVEAAYRRGDLFSKRAALMAAWATFCGAMKPAIDSNVAPIRQSA